MSPVICDGQKRTSDDIIAKFFAIVVNEYCSKCDSAIDENGNKRPLCEICDCPHGITEMYIEEAVQRLLEVVSDEDGA